jgi:hypothetical protein
MTNSFNLQVDLRGSSALPKMAIGFDDEDQVRFTASPKTTGQSKQTSNNNSDKAQPDSDLPMPAALQHTTRLNFVTPSILSKVQSPA